MRKKLAIKNLRQRPAALAGVLLALVLAIIWGSIAATLFQDREHTFADAQQDLRGMHNAMSTKVLSGFSAALNRAAAVEAWLAIASRTVLPPPLGEIIDVLKTMETTALQRPDIRLIGAGGEAISLTGVLDPYVDVSDREWFQGAMKIAPGQFHVGKTIVTRDTGREAIPIAIRAHDNVYGIALVVASLDLDQLRESVVGILEASSNDAEIGRAHV